MFTDSHCHLQYIDLTAHNNEPSSLLQAMKQANVSRAMTIMCQLTEYESLTAFVNQSDDELDIGMSVGIHPCQPKEQLRSLSVEDLLTFNHSKVWAFGETGLDYHWDSDKKHAQKHSFATHIHASQLTKKPIIVHTRAAYHDTLDVLKAEKCEHGIIHCFTEDYTFAKQALDLGLYISLSGILSFKKSTELQALVKKLPKDRLLIETDSPYLAPVPKRGKQNEPAFVPYVAQALGEQLGMDSNAIGRLTSDNFNHLLNQYAR